MEFWIFWLILIFVLIILEVCTINLVSIWFIASGIMSLILSFFIDNFFIQFSVFVILGVILLLSTRKFLIKCLKTNNEKTNLDRIIGETGIVTEKIKKNEIGEVKIEGKKWSAISNSEIEVGNEVVIDKIDGVKLIVRKKEEK